MALVSARWRSMATQTTDVNLLDNPLAWPPLGPETELALPAVSDMGHEVCWALEQRLEALSVHRLPQQVVADVDDMLRDLGHARRLLATSGGRADRLLADLQAWLPVCEAWIGRAGAPMPVRRALAS
jgi:hypothetical protein